MEIEGTYTLQATPEEVWQLLVDQQTLLHTLPEIEKLERVDDYTQILTLHFPYTPLLGTYYGNIRIAESNYPMHSRIIIESVRDTQGTMSGEATVDLESHEDTTILTYKCDISLHKPRVEIQRTVIKGAAKLLIQQFFTALEEQLWEQQATKKRAEEELIKIMALQRSAAYQDRSSQERTQQRVTFLQRIVHLLRLGDGNSAEEERWTQRIRRTGYASVLLFLVWVGTRIPRR